MEKFICVKDFNKYEKGKVYEFETKEYNTHFFKPFKFEVGDIVSHVLYDGEFELLDNSMKSYPFKIKDRFEHGFDKNGNFRAIQDRPSIHFIRRPSLEVKEKNEVVLYEFIDEHGVARLLDEEKSYYNMKHRKVTPTRIHGYFKIPNGRKLILDLDTWELSAYKEGEL